MVEVARVKRPVKKATGFGGGEGGEEDSRREGSGGVELEVGASGGGSVMAEASPSCMNSSKPSVAASEEVKVGWGSGGVGVLSFSVWGGTVGEVGSWLGCGSCEGEAVSDGGGREGSSSSGSTMWEGAAIAGMGIGGKPGGGGDVVAILSSRG